MNFWGKMGSKQGKTRKGGKLGVMLGIIPKNFGLNRHVHWGWRVGSIEVEQANLRKGAEERTATPGFAFRVSAE